MNNNTNPNNLYNNPNSPFNQPNNPFQQNTNNPTSPFAQNPNTLPFGAQPPQSPFLSNSSLFGQSQQPLTNPFNPPQTPFSSANTETKSLFGQPTSFGSSTQSLFQPTTPTFGGSLFKSSSPSSNLFTQPPSNSFTQPPSNSFAQPSNTPFSNAPATPFSSIHSTQNTQFPITASSQATPFSNAPQNSPFSSTTNPQGALFSNFSPFGQGPGASSNVFGQMHSNTTMGSSQPPNGLQQASFHQNHNAAFGSALNNALPQNQSYSHNTSSTQPLFQNQSNPATFNANSSQNSSNLFGQPKYPTNPFTAPSTLPKSNFIANTSTFPREPANSSFASTFGQGQVASPFSSTSHQTNPLSSFGGSSGFQNTAQPFQGLSSNYSPGLEAKTAHHAVNTETRAPSFFQNNSSNFAGSFNKTASASTFGQIQSPDPFNMGIQDTKKAEQGAAQAVSPFLPQQEQSSTQNASLFKTEQTASLFKPTETFSQQNAEIKPPSISQQDGSPFKPVEFNSQVGSFTKPAETNSGLKSAESQLETSSPFKPINSDIQCDSPSKPSETTTLFKPADSIIKPPDSIIKPADSNLKQADSIFKPSDSIFKPADLFSKTEQKDETKTDESKTGHSKADLAIPINFRNKYVHEIILQMNNQLQENINIFKESAHMTFLADEKLKKARNDFTQAEKAVQNAIQDLDDIEASLEAFEDIIKNMETTKDEGPIDLCLNELEKLSIDFYEIIGGIKDDKDVVIDLVNENINRIRCINDDLNAIKKI